MQPLPALDGWVDGVDLPENEKLGLLAVAGLETAGERALRNSVYACGGVMGVLMSSSCLTTSRSPETGLLGSSEGRVADFTVFNAGNVGLGDRGVLMIGNDGVGVGEADCVEPESTDSAGAGEDEAGEVIFARCSLQLSKTVMSNE